jgi:glycosyltransferase involved in cell wall biosynthesis
MRTKWAWSNGDGRLELPHGTKETFELELGRPGLPGEVSVLVSDGDGAELASLKVGRDFRAWTVTVPASTGRRELRVQSDTVTPAGDNRALGVALRRGGLPDLTPNALLVRRMPWLLLGREEDTSFLDHYDALVTISHYTAEWVKRLWGADSELLFPPIDVGKMAPEPVRDKTIITIGRFFDPVRGHGKRQLEMVDIFREALRHPELDGWTLHMVGGCEESNRAYFEKVMAASEGLPVELHPNAPRRILNRLINRASIFWSATGMNEDTERRPWRNEHFGMTTAEAMAAGCVPVVIDRAGQQEIVRDGIDGYRWETAEQAVARTVEVAGDPTLRERMARSAIVRAADFSDDAFAGRWREICADRGLLDPRAETGTTA